MTKELFEEIMHWVLQPDHYAYTTQILSELKLDDPSKAFDMQEEMLANRFPPNLITYNRWGMLLKLDLKPNT